MWAAILFSPAVRDIYVFLYKGTQYVTYTKAEAGAFLFKGLVDGTDYKILVTAEGYNSQWYRRKSNITTANTITSGTTSVTLTLTAAR